MKVIRRDAPGTKKRGRGNQRVALEAAGSPTKLQLARERLLGEFYAKTTSDGEKT